MCRYKLSAFLVFALTTTAVCDGNDKLANKSPEKIRYQKYLYDQGEKFDVYFTIERLANTKTRCSPLSATQIVPANVANIDELVKKLRDDLEGVTVARDKHNLRIVHLIDNELNSVEGYVVSTKATVSYSGTLYGLIKNLNGIGPPLMGGIPAPPEDYTTKTTVDATDELVRDILTDAVPLKGYNRIIWHAETLKIDGKYATGVRYTGQKTQDTTREEE